MASVVNRPYLISPENTPGESTPRCEYQTLTDGLRQALNAALKGKSHVTELVLACLLARGHLLIEDLPGLGKTTLAKALSQAIGGNLARVQCTPDLLPSDITGFHIYNQQTREFEFLAGPVFSDVLLADEINRATPRTQSALFEAMAERQVTIDKTQHRLPDSFFVIATQNPVESHGAYPLPEAQLDRFALKLAIGYPDFESECAMLAADVGSLTESAKPAAPVITIEQLQSLQRHVARIFVCPPLQRYLVELGAASRSHPQVTLGLSPRGLLLWQRLSQAWAFLQKRDFVIPDDIQNTAAAVLSVRLFGDFSRSSAIITDLLAAVAVPVHHPAR
ncbi:MAG: MoxR family ATPase [Pirellulales bacterium]|nr:MoxR family ATPase [Pirellulales bacterium]